MPFSRRIDSLARRTVGIATLAMLALGLGAAPASAAPSLGISLERDEVAFPVVTHSDERVDYTVEVANNAAPLPPGAPVAGEELFCNGAESPFGNKKWFRGKDSNGVTNYSFEFRWYRDGVPFTGWLTGPTATTYTAQAADEGKTLQCLVRGTNGAKSGAYVSASQPVAVVDPQPATAPPVPNEPAAFNRLPEISGVAESPGDELTCTAPAAWSGAPTWSFEWLRNGAPAPKGEVTETTATTSKFKLAESELASKAVFQCLATASNAGGKAIVESSFLLTTAPAPEFTPLTEDDRPSLPFKEVPALERSSNTVVGHPVTVVLALPPGQLTSAFQVTALGWACDDAPPKGADPASVTCTRADPLAPGDSYPPIEVRVALGSDAPDVSFPTATVTGGGSAPASVFDELELAPALPFGLAVFEAVICDVPSGAAGGGLCERELEGEDYVQAGGHPFAGVGEFVFNKKRKLAPKGAGEEALYAPIEETKQVIVDLPRGQIGNALATPQLCAGSGAMLAGNCPLASIVGGIDIVLSGTRQNVPIYALEPEAGTPAQFAFREISGNAFTLSAKLRPEDGYGISLEVSPAVEATVLESTATICDYGGTRSSTSGNFAGCKLPDEAGANPIPLFTNPTHCGKPAPVVRTFLNSWQSPGEFKESSFTGPEFEGCAAVPFEPGLQAQPTSSQADSPTGLDLELTLPSNGLEGKDEEGNRDPDAIAQSNLKAAKVVFPAGMAVNPSAGQGLGACDADQVKLGTDEEVECPEASKVGTIEVKTPILADTLEGDVYVARQGAVDGSLVGLYLVFESPDNGILIKQAVKVTPDPVTGQLTTTVSEIPEAPFSSVRMSFPGGSRATLITPPTCGTHSIRAELTPYSGGAPVVRTIPFTVDRGPGGGPCPTGALEARLTAGSTNPLAGQTSPFVVRLSREDGSQRFRALDVHLPRGMAAYLSGVPYCPEASIQQAIGREGAGQGQSEVDAPSCPAASQLGRVIAGAGAGDDPLYVDTGKAYLAGPYKGAPLSMVVIAPAIAGPLDLGTIVNRVALKVNPKTAEVDAVSDPVPTIKHGLLLDIRDVRVLIDRERFVLNPTSCAEKSVSVGVTGENGGFANLANRFQAAGCRSLGFKPRLYTRLFGATKRGGFPRFRAVYAPREGDSNFEDLVLRFPRSELIEQGHFRTICTRVQFNAGGGGGEQCPKGSVYGRVTVFTPILDEPLRGPVFLRSSDNPLPDVVFALRGQIEIEASARIDSVNGGLRAAVQDAPDAPIEKAIVVMQGGQKGLFVNSRDICASVNRASVRATAHNSRVSRHRPVLNNGRCKKQRRAKRKKNRAHAKRAALRQNLKAVR